ncbi:glycosyltransferase [Methylorubrum thiocyanatum]|uniref:glycosyltransferase n=1 Tax=Methylorubrum thiocyanatum TaxID=47958 RepID=UPI003839D49F
MLYNNYIPSISIISGIVNRGDAISETIVADIEAIDRISHAQRRNFDLKIFCFESNHPDTRIRVVDDWREVINDPHFLKSDLYYFHFGIFSEIHHAMHFARRNAVSVVYFHNVTQPQFCPPSAQLLIHKSYRQIENFLTADSIFSASHFSAKQLKSYGMGLDVVVIPLFGPNATSKPASNKSGNDRNESFRMMYCGRFAQSKGLDHLFEALTLASSKIAGHLELVLAGSVQFSDSTYMSKLKMYMDNLPDNISARFVTNSTNEEICALYTKVNILVLPSLHEGFGMPVAEALIARTPVICSDAGALPEVSAGFGCIYQAGNIQALSEAIVNVYSADRAGNVLCERGEMSYEDWCGLLENHAYSLTREAYIERIKQQFEHLLNPRLGWRDSARKGASFLPPAVGHSTPPDQLDCAVIGSMIAGDFEDKLRRLPLALRSLLRFVFDHDQSDDDIKYWECEWKKRGAAGLISHLSNSREVRSQSVRLQASVFLRHSIEQSGAKFEQAEKDQLNIMVPPIPVELELLAQDSRLSIVDFIYSIYKLVLKRDPDSVGIAHYVKKLRDENFDRLWLVNEIMNSAEAKSLREKTNMPSQ